VRSGCIVSPSSSVPVNPPARLFAVDCSGKPGLNAPEWSANLSYEHEFAVGADLRLIPGARTRVESSRYLAVDYLPEQRQGSYTMSDIYVTVEGPGNRWSLTGFVNNVEDKTVLASAAQRQFIPVVYSALRPPRTYGARVRFNF
jgi:iron complex outermembrane receptor protein